MRKKFIILGYGNPDRGDDGVAYHLLKEIVRRYSTRIEDLSDFQEAGILELSPDIDLWYNLQLIPEISQDLANYDHAIFMDAHTAEIPEPILVTEITPGYKNSPFTHHLTPASCLALAEKLYQHAPHATLVTIRGYAFDFSRDLSAETKELAEKALTIISQMIKKG
ncbi:MAG: hydrogenase maturation protease [Anaerolineaceae bacterium]|jgi:hydrogenase maturation protease|nr:MAG: hydrogenase maturation protease [Anaerolineaceae bacterium]